MQYARARNLKTRLIFQLNRAPALPLILNLAGHFTASFLDFMFLVEVRGTQLPRVNGQFGSSRPLIPSGQSPDELGLG